MLTPLAFALVMAAPASDCDRPGPVGVLGTDLSVAEARVEDGVAFVRLRVDAWPTREDGVLHHGETELFIPLPAADAIVTGASVRTAHGRDALSIVDVTRAELEMDAYRSVVFRGVPKEEARAGRKRAAASVAESGDGVEVRIIAACSEKRVTVELDVQILSTAQDGAWRFLLPRPQRDDTSALQTPLSVTGADLAFSIDGQAGADAQVHLTEEPFVVVDAWPTSGPRLRGRAGLAHVTPRAAVPIPEDDDAEAQPEAPFPTVSEAAPIDLLRAEVELPRPLAHAPDGLHLVFVVDASVSSGVHGLAAGWRMVERILDAAPVDARFAVIAVGRRPRVVVPAWRARDDRAQVDVPIENGSDVAAAVRHAQVLASDVDGVGRVIVLSDLAGASSARTIAQTLRASPLVHGIELPQDVAAVDDGGELFWQRIIADDAGTDDARAIERTGGILVSAQGGDEGERALGAHLIVPTRLDAPALSIGGAPLLVDEQMHSVRINHTAPEPNSGWPDVLHEGQGVRADIVVGQEARGAPSLRGFLWAERLEVPLVRTPARDRRALALAAVGALSEDLDDDVVRGAALEAGVVSRTTSLLFVPAWRPQEPEGLGMWGCGCGGCGCSGATMGFGRGVRTSCRGGEPVDLREREVLEAMLHEDLEACHAPAATLSVEVHDLEILEVAAEPGTSACVRERFWRHRLDTDVPAASLVPGAFELRKTLRIEARLENPAPGE